MHVAAVAPSSEHATDASFWLVQENVAFVDVVGEVGVDANAMVGAGAAADAVVGVGAGAWAAGGGAAGAGGTTAQAADALWTPARFHAETTKLWLPTLSPEYVFGLTHGPAVPWSSEHQTLEVPETTQLSVAPVEAVCPEGAPVMTTETPL